MYGKNEVIYSEGIKWYDNCITGKFEFVLSEEQFQARQHQVRGNLLPVCFLFRACYNV